MGSSLGRLSQYISAHTAQTWHLPVADDFHLEAGGAGYREALLIFFVLCHTAGVPLSWSKTAGGDTVIWVGFEILHRSFSLGVSERRAEWFVKWSETIASAAYVNMDSFKEGLGKIAYVAGALEFERPFLAPLYRFLTLHPRGSTRRVPAYVSFILRYLANQLRRQRHCNCESSVLQSEYAPRVDAQASLERTGIGGWRPVKDKNGNIDTRLSPWFSVEIRREDWPWIYERDDKPALVISALEALAILIALKLFYGSTNPDPKKVIVAPTWTDNRGNGALLNKLMTTKFPGCALLMELASFMKRRSMKVVVDWTPREGNKDADRLANGIVDDFTPDLEIKLDSSPIEWEVLPDALRMAREADSEYKNLKQEGRLPKRDQRKRKKRPEERLRLRDPW